MDTGDLSMLYLVTLHETIEAGSGLRVLEWHVSEGQECQEGQLLVELESFKAIIEIRARQQAYLRKIIAMSGEIQAPGKPIALLSDSPHEAIPANVATYAEMAVDYSFM